MYFLKTAYEKSGGDKDVKTWWRGNKDVENWRLSPALTQFQRSIKWIMEEAKSISFILMWKEEEESFQRGFYVIRG